MANKFGWLLKHPFVEKVDRWKVRYVNGYIIDRRIFLLLMVVIISLTIYGFSRYDWNFEQKIYLSCDSPTPCQNPLYERCSEWYCQEQLIPAGFEYGEKPDSFFMNFNMYVLLLVIVAFVLNHIIHNRNFELNVEDP